MIRELVQLRGSVQNCCTIQEIRDAWTKFSISERQKWTKWGTGEGRGGERSIKPPSQELEFNPLHEAVRYSNPPALQYYLVSV